MTRRENGGEGQVPDGDAGGGERVSGRVLVSTSPVWPDRVLVLSKNKK